MNAFIPPAYMTYWSHAEHAAWRAQYQGTMLNHTAGDTPNMTEIVIGQIVFPVFYTEGKVILLAGIEAEWVGLRHQAVKKLGIKDVWHGKYHVIGKALAPERWDRYVPAFMAEQIESVSGCVPHRRADGAIEPMCLVTGRFLSEKGFKTLKSSL